MKNNTKVISISSVKGGIGKSSATTNIAYAFARNFPDKKVLLIDFDPQATASDMLRLLDDSDDDYINNLGDLLQAYVLEKIAYDIDDIKNIIYQPSFVKKQKIRVNNAFTWKNVDVPYGFDTLPSSIKLSLVELAFTKNSLPHIENIDTVLKELVEEIKKEMDYDFIFIDSLPSLGILSVNVLLASDYLIIPTTMGLHSAKGLDYISELATFLNKTYRNNLKIAGILYNKVRKNGQVDGYMDDYIREGHPDVKIFNTKIIETIDFEKAVLDQKLVSYINKPLREAFDDLAKEIYEVIKWPERENCYGTKNKYTT